jgi:hypothetical protein
MRCNPYFHCLEPAKKLAKVVFKSIPSVAGAHNGHSNGYGLV